MNELWGIIPLLCGVGAVIGTYALIGYGIYRLITAIINYSRKHH